MLLSIFACAYYSGFASMTVDTDENDLAACAGRDPIS